MDSSPAPVSKRIFRSLLRVLPADFQSDYGREMDHTFEDQSRDARERGGIAEIIKLWWETIRGIFQTAPREHWEILKQDLTYAVRMMRKNPGFTVMATVILALGIGANTAIFSVVHAVLLRPLPLADSSRVMRVWHTPPAEPFAGRATFAVSPANYLDWR